MTKKIVFMIVSIVYFSVYLQANKLADIQKNKVIVVGIEEEFEPFNFISRTGKRIGFDIDMMQYIAKELGVKVIYKPMMFADIIPSVVNGKINVAIAAIMHKREREHNVDFSITYMYDGQAILAKKKDKYINYKSFAGKSLGSIYGHTSGKVFEAISPLSSIVYFYNLTEMLVALDAGVIDAITTDESVLDNIVKKNKKKYKIIGKKFTVQPYAIVLPENESKLRDAINFAIQKSVKTKEYAKIYKKWFKKSPSKNPVLWP